MALYFLKFLFFFRLKVSLKNYWIWYLLPPFPHATESVQSLYFELSPKLRLLLSTVMIKTYMNILYVVVHWILFQWKIFKTSYLRLLPNPDPSPDPSPEPSPDPSPEPFPDPSPEPSPDPSPDSSTEPSYDQLERNIMCYYGEPCHNSLPEALPK